MYTFIYVLINRFVTKAYKGWTKSCKDEFVFFVGRMVKCGGLQNGIRQSPQTRKISADACVGRPDDVDFRFHHGNDLFIASLKPGPQGQV
jgi:hypothetical protein